MDNGMWTLSSLIASLILRQETSNLKASYCSAVGSGILYSREVYFGLFSLIVHHGHK